MVYESLSEIFEGLNETRQTIYNRVQGLKPEQYCFKEETGRWSVAGVIEHIGAAEARILLRLREAIEQAEAAGQLMPARRFRPISTEEIISRTTVTRFQAPEAVQPKENLPLNDLLQKIQSSRNELVALRPKFEEFDLSELKFPHPVFGPLDLYQWLAFTIAHESRHLDQIDRILCCPDFPGPTTS
jgi:uncharacterized damage-inducible protein DinB